MRLTQNANLLGLNQRNRGLLEQTLFTMASAQERISTGWMVVTGAPGSGKTTLVAELESSGWRVIHDPARQVLEEHARPTSPTGREEYARIQQEILRRMCDTADHLDPQETLFFDYALPDNLAFLSVAGLPWTEEHIRAACRYKYRHVFVLENPSTVGEVERDLVRTESAEERRWIYHLLLEIYALLGMAMTTVSWTSVSSRLKVLTGSSHLT